MTQDDRPPGALDEKAFAYFQGEYWRWWLAREAGQRREVSAKPWKISGIELTNRCPFRCVMCARTNHMTRAQGLMDFRTFKAVIDQFVAADPEAAETEMTGLHHFGESLVHPRFGEFLRYAASKGVRRTFLSINPLLLTPSLSRDLLAGIHQLTVSLDGHDDESFFRIRGVRNAYEKSKRNLLALLEMKAAMRSKTVIHVGMIDFPMNRESIERLTAYWEALPGVDLFRRVEFLTWDGNAPDVNRLIARKIDNAQRRKTNPVVACNLPWERVSVAWDGDVIPCCLDYDKRYVLGNVRRQTMDEIWNGEKMRALRREFMSNDVRNPLCRNCPQLYLPAGGAA